MRGAAQICFYVHAYLKPKLIFPSRKVSQYYDGLINSVYSDNGGLEHRSHAAAASCGKAMERSLSCRTISTVSMRAAEMPDSIN